MSDRQLSDNAKAHLDKIRYKNHLGDGGRQSLSCNLSLSWMIRNIVQKIPLKKNLDPTRSFDNTPLSQIPTSRKEVRFVEAKTGETISAADAVEIIAKGTIFAVITTGEIKIRAKLLFRAAGIIYVENVSESEVENWSRIKG